MTRRLHQATFAVCAGMVMLALTALPARAIDINNLPDWVRDSIYPVEIDWSQVYPGLAPPPAWAQEPTAVQEVHPGAGTPQATGIGELSTISPAGPAGSLRVAHPTTAATGGLQTVSPSPLGGLQSVSPASGLGGLAPAHPSAAATAGLHEVNATPAAMTGLHEVKPASSATAGLQEVTPASSVTADLRPVSAGPIVGQINRLAPTDTQAQQLLLTWSAQLRDGTLNRDSLKQLITEQNVPSDTLIGVLNGLPLAHPMDPVYLPVCEVLWQRSGEKLDTCPALSYAPRIYLATYLGTLGREEDAKTLLSSLENPNKMALGADLYHVACQLLDYEECSFRLAIWCHKRGATLRGPADQAFVCWHIGQSCRKADDPRELARRELIPWAEEALARPGSESRWAHPLRELAWAYRELGTPQMVGQRGRYWLDQATRRGIPTDTLAVTMRALIAVCSDAGLASDAQAINDYAVSVIPDSGSFGVVGPTRQSRLQLGDIQPGKRESSCLLVTMAWPMRVQAETDLPFATVDVGEVFAQRVGLFYVRVTLRADSANAPEGPFRGALTLRGCVSSPFDFAVEHTVVVEGNVAHQ